MRAACIYDVYMVSAVSPVRRRGSESCPAPRGIGAAMLGLATVAWGGNQFTPLLVMYHRRVGYSGQTVTVLLAAYVLGIVPALLLGGPLSDRYGRRPLMLPAPLISAVGSLLLAAGAHSAGLLFAGRVLSGSALGLGMAVGTSWVKELVQAGAAPAGTSGAGRATTALTAGFAAGAASAAALAQFAPRPTVSAYLPHLLLAVAATLLLPAATETRRPGAGRPRRRLAADLVVPAARQRRFLLVVAPMAPFVFGLAGAAYAILPALLGGPAARLGTAVSGLHCLVGLSCGMAVQPLGARLGRRGPGRPVLAGLGVGAAGLLLGAAVVPAQRWLGFLLAAAVLGSAYGLLMVAGLQEVQRMAGPDDLAGLTAVYYALTYAGFIAPALLAALHHRLGYPLMFVGWAGLAAAAAALVLIGLARTGPSSGTDRAAPIHPVDLVGAGAD